MARGNDDLRARSPLRPGPQRCPSRCALSRRVHETQPRRPGSGLRGPLRTCGPESLPPGGSRGASQAAAMAAARGLQGPSRPPRAGAARRAALGEHVLGVPVRRPRGHDGRGEGGSGPRRQPFGGAGGEQRSARVCWRERGAASSTAGGRPRVMLASVSPRRRAHLSRPSRSMCAPSRAVGLQHHTRRSILGKHVSQAWSETLGPCGKNVVARKPTPQRCHERPC
jgi:hypothetical protein